jgi:acetylornithine aminotransferase
LEEPGLESLKKLQVETGSSLTANYSRYPVNFVSGKGKYLYDDYGNEYLDMVTGIGVNSFGHSHPVLLNAAENQLNSLWHVSNLYDSSSQEALAGKLIDLTGLDSVFFCNSGTEANEAAIKFARLWGNGRTNIITTLGGFHGRTMGSLSASGQHKLWQGFQPMTPGFRYVPFDDLESVKFSIDKHTVAVMVEPVQGENGIIVPTEGYLQSLRTICDEHNLLLILDEVQTGIGKTGKMFAYQWEEIKPDIVTSAKALANGLPLGATIVNEKVAASVTPGSHGSTFGGNPVSVAVAKKVLSLIDEDQLDYINETGEVFKQALRQITNGIVEVRGKGLMIGIQLHEKIPVKDIVVLLNDHKILTCASANNTLRLLPSFLININDIGYFISIFEDILDKFEL